jgi:hypothetical protein
MLNEAWDSACVKLFKFAKAKNEFKPFSGDEVEDLIFALKIKINLNFSLHLRFCCAMLHLKSRKFYLNILLKIG